QAFARARSGAVLAGDRGAAAGAAGVVLDAALSGDGVAASPRAPFWPSPLSTKYDIDPDPIGAASGTTRNLRRSGSTARCARRSLQIARHAKTVCRIADAAVVFEAR